MPRVLGLVAVGVLTVFTAGSAQKGCQDLVRSATSFRYPVVRDMRHSVAIMPQKGVLLPPDSASVPVTGIDRDRGREVLAVTMVNPTPATDLAASIGRGEVEFRTLCVPCHGRELKGDGPVAALFMSPPDLQGEMVRQAKDGFLYSYIRHGGVVMPAHGAQVSAQGAWDLINYIRQRQKVQPR